MIYSMMGSAIERITDYDDDSGAVRFIRASDKAVRTCNITQLKADGGMPEIEEAVATIVSEAKHDWP